MGRSAMYTLYRQQQRLFGYGCAEIFHYGGSVMEKEVARSPASKLGEFGPIKCAFIAEISARHYYQKHYDVNGLRRVLK